MFLFLLQIEIYTKHLKFCILNKIWNDNFHFKHFVLENPYLVVVRSFNHS